MFRVLRLGSVIALVLASSCSSGDYELERRGGPFPADPIGDPPLGSAGMPPDAQGGAGPTGALIPFCDALTVVRAKCQRCHTNPPENGAPVPFLTYEDFQVFYFEPKRWWERAKEVVEIDYMPYVDLNEPPVSLMPPVEPLTPEEKATLMGWFEQGALPEGGTECPE